MDHTAATSPSDADLLGAWRKRRDERAFEELCRRHAQLVAATCRRLGATDIDEASQAVFIVLARRPAAVGTASRLTGWLIGVARRVVANQRRDARRRHRHEGTVMAEFARAASDETPSAWQETIPLLDQGLAQLSPGRREAVVKYYLQGRPQAEIAAELHCSAEAVKTRVHEGLIVLRRFFAGRGVAISLAAIASGMAAEAAVPVACSTASCVQAGLAPGSFPIANQIATGVLKTMLVHSLGWVAALSSITAVLLCSALAAQDEAAHPRPAEPPAAEATAWEMRRYDLAGYGLAGPAETPALARDRHSVFASLYTGILPHEDPPADPVPIEEVIEMLRRGIGSGRGNPPPRMDLQQGPGACLWVSASTPTHREIDTLLKSLGRNQASLHPWSMISGIIPADASCPAGLIPADQCDAIVGSMRPESIVHLTGSSRSARVSQGEWQALAADGDVWRNCQVRILPGLALTRVDLDLAWSDHPPEQTGWGWRQGGTAWLERDQALVLMTSHPQGRAVAVVRCSVAETARFKLGDRHIYPLQAVLVPRYSPHLERGAAPEELVELGAIIEQLRTAVEPASWSEEKGASVEEYNGSLEVAQTLPVQAAVKDFLVDVECHAAQQVVFTLYALPEQVGPAVSSPTLDGTAWSSLQGKAQMLACWTASVGQDSVMVSGEQADEEIHAPATGAALPKGLFIAARPIGTLDGLRVRLQARVAAGEGPALECIQATDERQIPVAGVALLRGRHACYALGWRLGMQGGRTSWSMPAPAPEPQPAPKQAAPADGPRF